MVYPLYIFTPDQQKKIERAKRNNKEFLYIGHYVAVTGEYVLKIGTTNDLQRRASEHTRNYHRTPNYPMPADSAFIYDDFIPLSHYSTLRFEENNKEMYKNAGFGEYLNNDRFIFREKPSICTIKIRKTYEIAL